MCIRRNVLEPDDEDGDIVLRALPERVIDEELASLLRILYRADFLHRVLVTCNIPKLRRQVQ